MRFIIPASVIKAIPKVLNNPMLIIEYVDKSGRFSINVYGKLYIGTSPVVVGIIIGKHRNGQSVDKIQTVHPNRNFLDEVTESNALYLGENKKETNAWFQAFGAQEPTLGGTKYGFIRMLGGAFGCVHFCLYFDFYSKHYFSFGEKVTEGHPIACYNKATNKEQITNGGNTYEICMRRLRLGIR